MERSVVEQERQKAARLSLFYLVGTLAFGVTVAVPGGVPWEIGVAGAAYCGSICSMCGGAYFAFRYVERGTPR
jgi:hypothetical protein